MTQIEALHIDEDRECKPHARRGTSSFHLLLGNGPAQSRLLSGKGSFYVSGELVDWLEDQKMEHVRGASNHLQTQARIERLRQP